MARNAPSTVLPLLVGSGVSDDLPAPAADACRYGKHVAQQEAYMSTCRGCLQSSAPDTILDVALANVPGTSEIGLPA